MLELIDFKAGKITYNEFNIDFSKPFKTQLDCLAEDLLQVESGRSATVRPGCIVIIPSKAPSEPVKWSEIVGMLSSTASMSAIVISAINMASK